MQLYVEIIIFTSSIIHGLNNLVQINVCNIGQTNIYIKRLQSVLQMILLLSINHQILMDQYGSGVLYWYLNHLMILSDDRSLRHHDYLNLLIQIWTWFNPGGNILNMIRPSWSWSSYSHGNTWTCNECNEMLQALQTFPAYQYRWHIDKEMQSKDFPSFWSVWDDQCCLQFMFIHSDGIQWVT